MPFSPDGKEDGFAVVGAVLAKLQRRLNYKITECEVDRVKTDHCINAALSVALRTVNYMQAVVADPGEQRPLGPAWVADEELTEPLPSPKDLFATMSLPSASQRTEALPNLYEEVSHESHKALLERRAQIAELKVQRKKHLVIKHGAANVVGSVGELWVSEGAVKVLQPRQVEADDELAQKVREDKNNQRLKQERHEREAKDRVAKNRLRAIEIDNVNKELEKTSAFTFDFQGNVLVQNHQVGEQLPPDFKFKYKFKKGRKRAASKPARVPFEEGKQTGKADLLRW